MYPNSDISHRADDNVHQDSQASDSANTLGDLREKIDAIDKNIIELLRARLDIAQSVAEYKRTHARPILDKTRERAHLADIAALSPEMYREEFQTIFELIMQTSRMHQAHCLNVTSKILHDIAQADTTTEQVFPRFASVACQGIEGAYQQIATDKMFRHARLNFYPHFHDVFEAVETGVCRFGVVPLENSTAGSVTRIFDLMRDYQFYIVKTVRLKVDHNLLAQKGTKLEDIRHIYSHEQALSQCANFLSTLPNVEIHPCKNTALAAQIVAEKDTSDCACISSIECSELYDLDIVSQDIQDTNNNYTRFACISKTLEIYPGAQRASLMLTCAHKPGSLYTVLQIFYTLGINIIKLESRPIVGKDFEFMFYFDINCPHESPEFAKLMCALEAQCRDVKYLGSYNEVM